MKHMKQLCATDIAEIASVNTLVLTQIHYWHTRPKIEKGTNSD